MQCALHGRARLLNRQECFAADIKVNLKTNFNGKKGKFRLVEYFSKVDWVCCVSWTKKKKKSKLGFYF